ncbi:ribonuclease P protein subunit [Candidatus Woesearchaeota archaeon]|jgi:ribonuclease P protein subunit POP4|nr:ribonuclease P protein subunit [Candidatus Woesearchaeota archaeon]MBT4835206.1 ribonuclease P protein subunit [Candidatus Woesearchaeota archaeon]MBT6734919.1 ribonuclease P protein subunit [Candidatus Woesearchaeota archaeon]MBT7169566.1 ribonuclease P protein subunit [Candidatus Woesearchaeota archaeon]MBT7474524.1 ribonuclease P protein subunit [Candidatus Woesearchaeota archaeon]
MVKSWKKEIIGEKIIIINSKNKSLLGMEGNVIEETKNTITLGNGKKLLKSHITIKINGEIIEGKTLQKKPEDRIKK